MYKIMIVDDEYNARDGLENVIDWGRIGAKVVGSAADGEDALAKIPRLAPDIVITDVKMDRMDGLEMTQRIGELYPRIKTIVLSGYDEPEYIRKSLGLKVFAYLLKPVRGKEILETARGLIEQLERENSLLRRVELMEEEFGRNRDYLHEHFLRDLLLGSVAGREQFAERAAFLQLSFPPGSYRCALLAIDGLPRAAGEHGFQKLRGVRVVAEGLLRERQGGEAWLVGVEPDRLALILDARTCESRLDGLVESVKALLGVSVTAAVGSGEDIFDIWRSYRQAAIVCDNNIAPGVNGVVCYSDMPPPDGSRFLYPREKERALLESASSTDAEIAAMAADLLDEMERQGCSRERMIAEVAGFLGQHARKAMDMGVDVYRLFGREALDPFRLFERYGERERIQAWLANILSKTRDEILREKAGRAGSLVGRASAYISANFSRSDISLDMVAAHLKINPSYFSRLFKKETGASFIDALTELRVGKSKELLGRGGERVADIAAAVGFQSTRYFCTLFKKNVGCSPTEYRDQAAAEGGHGEGVRGESGRGETGRAESGRGAGGRAESSQGRDGHAEWGRAEGSRAETGRAEGSWAESGRIGGARG
ncbi:MAG: response regulator [Clostridiales bacterium]|jgi:two-component system response regulator YesN|nr:response regulator [Clostridiales bacterium]